MTADVSSDRAEDLSSEEVLRLFVDTGPDGAIVERLTSPGTHLLQGSRGTGKTMLLRVAYERIREQTPSVLPVFVSFSRYLATANPSTPFQDYGPFHSWVIAKLYQHCLLAAGDDTGQLEFADIPLQQYIERLELHYRDPHVADRASTARELQVRESRLVEFDRLDSLVPRIHAILDKRGLGSVVLLLDEATQNFAEELQPQFFRIIRHLRDARVAVKIAVYPQATVYGRDFDVGQDAIVLPIERHVEDAEAMSFFTEFLHRRVADGQLQNLLQRSPVQRDFLIKMSGGNPRWLLHLLNRLSSGTGESLPVPEVLGIAKEFPDTTLWPYLSGLKTRLVAKRRYVEAAVAVANLLIEDLRQLNEGNRGRERPTPYVAVSQSKELPFRVRAALGLLEYSGLIYRRGPKRITSRENAQSYLMHPAILVKENCLYPLESNPSIESLVRAFSDPPKDVFKEYTKNSPRLLLELATEESADICEQCGTELSEGSKFCHKCGKPVATSSLFEELRAASSSELELTPGIKQRLGDDGRFPSVGSVLDASDDELDEIRYVGVSRVRLIRSAAEEFVAG